MDLAPAPGLDRLAELINDIHGAGVDVDVRIEGTPRALSPGQDVSAYRIAQEALTNVVRHAGPTSAVLTVRYQDDGLEIECVDQGRRGAASPATNGGGGHGIIGMQERAALYGGEVVAAPAGRGFRVWARLPYLEEPD